MRVRAIWPKPLSTNEVGIPRFTVRTALRLFAGAGVVVAFAVSPELALAQAPGSLAELASSPTTGSGLTGTQDVAVSPDGKNVYAIGLGDDAIAEFTRGAGGSLTQPASTNACVADSSDSGSSCSNQTATGLVAPQAIVISPDGANVYVAAHYSTSTGTGAIAEFARGSNGSLSPISGHDCIAENPQAPCDDKGAHGIQQPTALAISPDGHNVYVVDEFGEDIAEFSRGADGSLTQLASPDDCIQDATAGGGECTSLATGLSQVTGVVVSPDGNNVYTSGAPSGFSSSGSIAEFSRGANGALTQLGSPNNCIGTPESSETCGGSATGVTGFSGLAMSPDGTNVYSAAESRGGPIAEFSRGAGGALTQLAAPNNCIQEQGGTDFGCGTTGIGIGDGFRLVVSPDGASVYAPAESGNCNAGTCSDVAEFARQADGSLAQLAPPDSCIQDTTAGGSECPGNENGTGLGGPGLAISPDGTNVYVTGQSEIADFARTPVTHTLAVTLQGSGSGAVSDGTGAIACPSTCSNAYTANSQVTLTVTSGSGSTFTGWSGACSGTGACQVTMSTDTAVTATFTSTTTPTPGSPTPVLTGAPAAVTDGGAGFSGSVNPDGLATTAYFQYGLDQRYSQVGASGPNYTSQTPAQTVGSDFTTHGVGPVTVTGLVPNALYHVRLVATNSAGTTLGQDLTFTTAAAPSPGAPTLGKTFNIQPVSGLVLIDINGHLVPLTELTQIPAGVAIDTLHGTLKLTTASGGGGGAHDAAAKTQTGEFRGAVFRLSQQTRGAGKGLVTVMLALSAFKGAPSQSICKSHAGAADATAASSRTIQLLHASAHGKFRTSGRYSAATVLGTIWTVAARCDGTLTHSIKDPVEVTDFIRHKTIILHAGQSYLAPGRVKHG
jgi:DNA-binding beta-propeller fold protein YncE